MTKQDSFSPANGQLRKADVEAFPIRRAGQAHATKLVNGKAKPVSARDVRRIEKLVIPPGWHNVRISADPRSHIQAVGRDEAGRRQYIYHREWEAVRSADKARRLRRLIGALPRIRRMIADDLDRTDDRRVLATAARLVDRLCFRAGHEEYAGEESGRGVATLLKRHVRISGATLSFDFPGKGKKRIIANLTDRRVARNISQALNITGRRLFKLRMARAHRNMTANDLNRYLASIAKCDVSAKDFRTLRASSMALDRIRDCVAKTKAERRHAMGAAAKEISEFLANTPAVVRRSYIHTSIMEYCERGTPIGEHGGPRLRGCTKAEMLLHQFLSQNKC